MRGRVKQCRRARHEVKARQQLIELNGTCFAICLVQRQTHGHAHEKRLRHFEAAICTILASAVDQEVTVIQRLQAQKAELEVPRVIERRTEFGEVVAGELRVEQTNADAVLDKFREVFAIFDGHVGLRRFFFENLKSNRVKQQTRRDETVSRVFFDVLSSREHHAFAHFFGRNAVVQIFKRCFQNQISIGRAVQAVTGRNDELAQAQQVERLAHAVVHHMQDGLLVGFFGLCLRCALLRTLFAVQHIGASDFVFAGAHQRQLDLILNFLDMNRAAFGLDAHQCAHHCIG